MMLRTGSTGNSVRQLQESLNYLEMADPPLVVDGIFGPLTRAAVVAFQDDSNLAADGIVGPMTAQALAGSILLFLIAGQ